MLTSPNSPEIPSNLTSTISTPKIDKVVTKIQKLKTTLTLTTSNIPNKAIPDGISTTKNQEPSGANTFRKSNDIIPTSSSKTTTENVQVKEDKPKKFKTMKKTKNTLRQQRPRGKAPYPILNRATSTRKNFLNENSSRRLGECGTVAPISRWRRIL